MNVEEIPIAELDLDPANVRQHDEKNLAAIKSSLKRFGQQKPIVVDPKGIVIAGNGTLTAARALGWDRIRIVRTQLEGSEATAYAIADNRTAELATWDDDALMQQLSALDLEDSALVEAAGFSAAELEGMVDGLLGEKELNEDEVPEVPEDPITKPGDLWILGDHRLLCGDSTKAEDVERLMNGKKADLCLTDPPYGLGDKKESGKNDYDIHEDTQENLIKLIAGWLPIARSMCSTVIFSPGVTNLWLYPHADWVMCWFYGAGQLMSSWGFNCWQPFLCYGKDSSLATGNGGRPDAINMNTPANAADINHPCPKPVKLWQWFIERMSFSKGDLFYEPFCGSGTTLIAAEQLGRRCFGMEISPQYCDVIVERWENLTGRKAELERRADDDQEKIQSQA